MNTYTKNWEDKFKIYPEYNFGVFNLKEGTKSVNGIIKSINALVKDKNIKEMHYLLIDMRGCEFDFKLSDVTSILNIVALKKDVDKRKKTAYLIDTPFETAIAQFFVNQLTGTRLICSTMTKAYEHLGLPIDMNEFEKLSEI